MTRSVQAARLLPLLLAASPCAAQQIPIDVNSFASAANLPVWVAQHQALFRHHGIEVTLTHPHGSVDQFQGVADGRYPVVLTAFDNIVAYREGQGAPQVGAIPDLVAVAGLDSGFLTLIATPTIATIAALKGHTMAVDALSTGFSFALKGILSRNGIAPDQVSYIAVGSSDGRLHALQEGKAQAALLTLPADLVARTGGDKALTTVTATLGPYAANVVAVRQGWAQGHHEALSGFLRGYREGLHWMLAHKQPSIDILHQEMPDLPATMLQPIYAELSDRSSGLIRDLRINPKAAQTVLSLRATYAAPPHPLQPLATYIDTSYVRALPK